MNRWWVEGVCWDEVEKKCIRVGGIDVEDTNFDEKSFLGILYDISLIVSGEGETGTLLDALVKVIPEKLGAKGCFIMLKDIESGIPTFKAFHGLNVDPFNGTGIEGERAEVCFRSGESVVVDSSGAGKNRADLSVNADIRLKDVYFPMVVDGVALGVLAIFGVRPGLVTNEEGLKILKTITNYITAAVSNSVSCAGLKKKATRLKALYNIGKSLTYTLEIKRLLEMILETLDTELGFHKSALLLLERKTGDLFVEAARGYPPEVIKKTRLKVGEEGICGWVAANRASLLVDDVSRDERYVGIGLGIGSELAVPITLGEKVIGVLDVADPETGAYTEEDIHILDLFAAQAAIALDNARLFRDREELVSELRESDKLKSEFVANMSHELRTPLTSIIGFSELLLDEVVGELNETQRQSVDDILSSGRYLLSLINQILDLSKIEAGRMEYKPTKFSIETVMSEAVSTARILVEKKDQQLIEEIEPDLPEVYAEKEMIKQVILNLLSNAVKFAGEDGIISISARLSHPENLKNVYENARSTLPDYPLVTISIKDNGIGISEQDQEIIFHEFRQVDGSYTREYQGTGLGLALARRFVELNEGIIWVESEPGEGSTFSFTLHPAENRLSPHGKKLASRQTILVIEDDRSVSRLIGYHLRKIGCRMVHVMTGPDGLAKAKEIKPAIIILDVMLPGMDGWEVLQKLKQSPETAGIPVIITSIIENRELLYSLGAADYLPKPVDRKLLLEKIEELRGSRFRNILIVDHDFRRLTKAAIFLENSYEITRAYSDEEGIDIIEKRIPDMVIVAVSASGGNGFKILRYLRERTDEADVEIPVLVIDENYLGEGFERSDLSTEYTGEAPVVVSGVEFSGENLLKEIKRIERGG